MSKATITAKTGIGTTITSKVITGITRIDFDLVAQTLKVYVGSNYQEFDISANNTSTLTYSAPDYTLTIS